jgi:CBS domain-containing protein
MRISDILQEKGTNVVTIDSSKNIHEAINRLRENRIGALVVTRAGEEVAGILTERDILRECGERCGIAKTSTIQGENVCSSIVQDAMTKEVVTGVPDDDPNYVLAVMTKNRIRHLPILDEGRLTGIISIGDLVNAHLEERVLRNRTLKDYLERNSSPKSI